MDKLLLHDGAGVLIGDTQMDAQFTPKPAGRCFPHPINGAMRRFIVFDISRGTFSVSMPNGKTDEKFGDIVSAHEFEGSSERLVQVNRMR